jgi:hypothetical protein
VVGDGALSCAAMDRRADLDMVQPSVHRRVGSIEPASPMARQERS